MLHWQRYPKWFKDCSLLSKIICSSIIGHLAVLFTFLFVYKSDNQYKAVVSSTIINTNAPIIFVPLYKSIKQTGSSGSMHTASKGMSGQKKIHNAASSVRQSGTTLASIAKKTSAKAIKKKDVKKTTPKKNIEKKSAAKQTEIKEKKEIKQVEVKKVEPEVQQAVPLAPATQSLPQSTDIIQNINEEIQPLYVGQEELEALQIQEYIQQELVQHWKPPLGMRSDLQCLLKIIIDNNGQIQTVITQQASGSALFDSAACMAASKFVPTKNLFGKELLITFKP